MASYAPAAVPHMAADTLNREYGLNIAPIQYKGEGPMWPDVASGQVSGGIGSYQAIAPYLAKERVKPLAVTGTTRIPKLPDVKTFEEQGYPQPVFKLSGGLPMLAPAGTPEAVLQKLASTIQDAFDDPKVKAVHDVYGIPERPTTLEETRRRNREDGPQWIALARSLNVKLD
jgi:tripartite-type tricarboxylate transporter receptor subunit TctC